MAKGNKHVEVKPSKFKTTLCQYYMVSQECPYGARCVFAHGEADLHTEEANVELLKTTGLQRLDGFFGAVHGDSGLGSVYGNSSSNNSSNGGVGGGGGDVVTAATSPSGLTSTPTSAHDDVLVTMMQQQQQQQQQPQSPLLRSVRRRPIMVSLPKHTTSNEAYSSPYIDDDVHTAVSLYNGGGVGGVCSHHAQHGHDGGNGNTTAAAAAATAEASSMAATATSAAQLRCSCAFASSCQQERPIVYRHNPYSIY